MHEIERVAIVGAGAMGAMYATHFADGGFEVTLAASGARAEGLRRDGLMVNGELRRFAVGAAPDGAPPADLIVVAVKHHQLGDALDDVAPLVGPDTTLLSVLNGLDSEDVIAGRFGADGVLLCIALAMDAMRDGTTITYRQTGRLVYPAKDTSVEVELIPTGDERGAGSRVSLAAFRVLEAPLTDLPTLDVYAE